MNRLKYGDEYKEAYDVRLADLKKEVLILEDEMRNEKIALDILEAAFLPFPDNTERLKVISDKIWEFFLDQKKECERLSDLHGSIQEEVHSLKYL